MERLSFEAGLLIGGLIVFALVVLINTCGDRWQI